MVLKTANSSASPLLKHSLFLSMFLFWATSGGCVEIYGQAALRQFSHAPYLELKLPPPLSWAYSDITARAQTSQVLAISPSDMGCDRLRSDMLNLDLAFTERSSYSLLAKSVKPNL